MPLLSFPVWAYPVWVGCLVLVAWSGYRAVRDRPVIFKQLIVGAVVEVLLLVQVVLGIVAAAGGHVLAEPTVFWGYVVVALLVLPAAAVVAIAERTRWGSLVLLLLTLTLAFLEVRMVTLWGAGA